MSSFLVVVWPASALLAQGRTGAEQLDDTHFARPVDDFEQFSARSVPGAPDRQVEPHQPLANISLPAWAKPITALNLKQGKRGSLTASSQPAKRSTSPTQTSLQQAFEGEVFAEAPGGSGSPQLVRGACARTVCQNG